MLKNNFIKNILILATGTAFSQIIIFISLPIITRLYSVNEFGILSLFIAIVAIISLISSLRYESAIMLPKSEKNALSLFVLSFIILVFITLSIIVIMYLFKSILINNYYNLEIFYWLIPLNIFILGAYQIFVSFYSRKKEYKSLALNRIIQSSSIAGLQVSNGYYNFFELGLIYSKIIGELLSLLVYIKRFLNQYKIKINKINILRIISNAKIYKNFPKYQTLSVFVNSLSQNFPVILLTFFYSIEIGAFYALTIRIIQAPISLIGGSIRQVYYQEASELFRNNKSILNLYIKTTLNMTKLFIIPFFIILIFGKDIFTIFFGNKWEISGLFAQILIFWIFTTFINPPSTLIFQIFNIQNIQLNIELISLLFRFLAIYLGFLLFNSYYYSIFGFMIISSITNIYIIFYIHKKVKKQNANNI
jgi:lipopolysaccharide exporter